MMFAEVSNHAFSQTVCLSLYMYMRKLVQNCYVLVCKQEEIFTLFVAAALTIVQWFGTQFTPQWQVIGRQVACGT